MLIRTGKYPEVLRNRPNDERISVTRQDDTLVILGVNPDVKVVATDVILLDDGVFYQAVMPPTSPMSDKPRKRIVGLVAYESLFNPDIEIPERLDDNKLEGCVTIAQVVEKCLPANWRLTAEQQAELPAYIAESIARWQALRSDLIEEEKPERPRVHPADID
jgi:hypothetical protein